MFDLIKTVALFAAIAASAASTASGFSVNSVAARSNRLPYKLQ